tara:strand:- start:991 stop:1656 length:666 start_codon:yes stop_codon:yes gene_type:complete
MGYYIGSRAIALDVPFTDTDGVQRPANWLRNSSARDRELLGIVWQQPTDSGYDQRFFWGVGNPKQLNDQPAVDADGNDLGYTQTGLKTQWKSTQEQIAQSLLSLSDWRVVKELEVNSSFAAAKTAFPTTWQTYRAAVRTSCNTRQTEINACSTVDALKELLFGSATIAKTKEQQKTDDDGKGVVDSDDNPVMETVNDLDSDGNIQMIANPAIATAWPTELS